MLLRSPRPKEFIQIKARIRREKKFFQRGPGDGGEKLPFLDRQDDGCLYTAADNYLGAFFFSPVDEFAKFCLCFLELPSGHGFPLTNYDTSQMGRQWRERSSTAGQ